MRIKAPSLRVRFAMLLAAAMLSACGWQLRQPPQLDALDSLRIEGHYAGLRSELENQLDEAGITSGKQSTYVLYLVDEEQDRRIASVDRFGRASEIELTHEVRYYIADGSGQMLTETDSLMMQRTVRTDPENATASSEEEDDALQELQQGLSRQLLRRIEAFALQLKTRPRPGPAVEVLQQKNASPTGTAPSSSTVPSKPGEQP